MNTNTEKDLLIPMCSLQNISVQRSKQKYREEWKPMICLNALIDFALESVEIGGYKFHILMVNFCSVSLNGSVKGSNVLIKELQPVQHCQVKTCSRV